jgi:hypothetical protein
MDRTELETRIREILAQHRRRFRPGLLTEETVRQLAGVADAYASAIALQAAEEALRRRNAEILSLALARDVW